MTEDNIKGMKRIMLDGFGAGDLSVIDEVVADNCVDHQFGGGREDLAPLINQLRTAFPDLHYKVVRITADGDTVWGHFRSCGTNRGPFMGRPPTGKAMEVDVIEIMRFENGKLVEHWGVPDRLAVLEQLGHWPPR
jgi:predicted ester cyclase